MSETKVIKSTYELPELTPTQVVLLFKEGKLVRVMTDANVLGGSCDCCRTCRCEIGPNKDYDAYQIIDLSAAGIFNGRPIMRQTPPVTTITLGKLKEMCGISKCDYERFEELFTQKAKGISLILYVIDKVTLAIGEVLAEDKVVFKVNNSQLTIGIKFRVTKIKDGLWDFTVCPPAITNF